MNLIEINLCKHSQEEVDKLEPWLKWLEERDIDWDTWYHLPYTKKSELGNEYWSLMKEKYGRLCVMLGPEEFYSSPYCKKCLLEYIEEIDSAS